MTRPWVLLFTLALGSSAHADPARVSLAGRVNGASGKHAIYVALWQSDGFLQKPVRQIRIAPGAEAAFGFQLSAGRWALSAFEDRNDNGVLDMGLFGPKEPSGFWRPFTAWRRPKFEDVAVLVTRDTANANIALR